MGPEIWEAIALEASRESRLWSDCLLPSATRQRCAIFSPLGEARYALGLETIYEGYLVHYGRSRLFAPAHLVALAGCLLLSACLTALTMPASTRLR